MVCPDLLDTESPTIMGDNFDEAQKNFEFRISMCNNKTRGKKDKPCATLTEIKKFVRRIQVEHFVFQEQIDLTVLGR